tara:strand:+ start:1619 stop:1984 length:366 start_codon:yes stop_codon:yes gene_type:complete
MNFNFMLIKLQKTCQVTIILFALTACSSKNTKLNGQDFDKENSFNKEDSLLSIKDGEVVSYHKNGKVQSIGHFTNGIANGTIIVYDSNGNELYRGRFENGKPKGEWIFTNPKNNEKTIKSY